MKVAVINFSGNVGKSTVARHLLAPRMNAEIIAVESINSDGTDSEAIKGKQFGQLQEYLLVSDSATVIDIGASNVEDFVNLMKQYRGSHEDFDYFVVPVVPKTKQQRDTISTIDALAEIGIPAKKLRLLFNMVELDEDIETVFAGLFAYHKENKNFTLRPDAFLPVTDIYGKLKGDSMGIAEILADKTDYKAKLKEAKDQAERMHFAEKISLQRQAADVVEDLDAAYKALFK